PWDERTSRKDQINAGLGAVNGYLFGMRNARGFAFNLPEIIGLGTTAGLEMNLQDRGVNDVQRFAGFVNDFTREANGRPELRGVYSTLRVNTPQLYVQVDREKAKALGISLTDLFQTLQAFLSTLYINDFNLYGKTYRVQAEAQPKFRQTPEDIGRLYVRGPNQHMVPVSALTHTQFQAGPSVLTRFNGFTSALVIGAPAPGKSSGQMLDAVERLVQEKYAGQGVGYAFSGQSYQERASGGQGGLGAAPDSPDLVRIRSGRRAARGVERRWSGESPLDRHGRVLRDARRDHRRDLLHPAVLRGHPRPERAGSGATTARIRGRAAGRSCSGDGRLRCAPSPHSPWLR